MFREAFVDEGVVSRQELGHAAVVPHDAVEQQFGFLAERLMAVVPEHAASAAALQQAADADLGTETFQLAGARGFRPDAQRGRKIEARGLINRSAGENRLDVLSLSSVGIDCGP